jgi:outer membrane murein-binding lipoprotein Lpp
MRLNNNKVTIKQGECMRGLAVALIAVLAVGCAKETISLPDYGSRISDLERRADLNDQMDALRDALIQANADAIAAESQARIAGDIALQELLDLEEAARIAGDLYAANQLSTAISAQSIVNWIVQIQLLSVNSQLGNLSSQLGSLQVQLNTTNSSLTDLKAQVDQLDIDLAALELRQDAAEGDISNLQTQLSQEGVKLFKCNSPNSTERIMQINGYFYGVMNRVKTQNIQVVTGSSSETFVTPALCDGPGNSGLSLPPCHQNATPVPSSTVTVPSYTTATVKVVTEVKMALDILPDGNYITTDGGAACPFSISGGGTQSSGLVPVQGGL